MNTIFASTLATLTVEYFEVHLYGVYKDKWRREFKDFLKGTWSRFLDNCKLPVDREKVQPQELLGSVTRFTLIKRDSS